MRKEMNTEYDLSNLVERVKKKGERSIERLRRNKPRLYERHENNLTRIAGQGRNLVYGFFGRPHKYVYARTKAGLELVIGTSDYEHSTIVHDDESGMRTLLHNGDEFEEIRGGYWRISLDGTLTLSMKSEVFGRANHQYVAKILKEAEIEFSEVLGKQEVK